MMAGHLAPPQATLRPSNRFAMAKAAPVSPLAPVSFPEMPAIPGVRFATAEAGIRYKGRTDVLFLTLDEGTQAAGVFTSAKCPSDPVDWCRHALQGGKA